MNSVFVGFYLLVASIAYGETGVDQFSAPAPIENACVQYIDSRSDVAAPTHQISKVQWLEEARKNRRTLGFYKSTEAYVDFLCDQIPSAKQNECVQLASSILFEAMNCLKDEYTIKQIKPMTWSILRNAEFSNLVRQSISEKTSSTAEQAIVASFWNEFRVLIFPAGTVNKMGTSRSWTPQDLIQLKGGFVRLKQSVINRVGSERAHEFSHLWGAGVSLTKQGVALKGGQLAEIFTNFPMQIHIVIDVDTSNKSASTLAQHLGHESSHSNDQVWGRIQTGDHISWSYSTAPQVFKACSVAVNRDSSLENCRQKNRRWFNFHYSYYAAINSSEFYTKMTDEWVRENLNLVKPGQYRCQNQQTLSFWNEMEQNLIGEIISAPCP